MTYTIEKNVPMPIFKIGRGYNLTQYPFCEMKIGDSFLVKWEAHHPTRQSLFVQKIKNRVSAASVEYRKKHNSKARFLCEYEQSKGSLGGVRVWRIC